MYENVMACADNLNCLESVASTGKDSSSAQISSRAWSRSEAGSASVPDELSFSQILHVNFSLINFNRSRTERMVTRNFAV